MGILRRTRQAQYPLVAEFVFNYTDGMTPLAGLDGPSVDLNRFPGVTDMGSGVIPTGMLTSTVWTPNPGANTTYFEIMTLPNGAQVIGGDVQVEVPYTCNGTATITVGDSDNGTMYLASTNIKGTAFTNLPTSAANSAVAGSDPTLVTYTNATANGVSAAGQTVFIAGMAPAVLNGTFVVDSYTATTVVVRNEAVTTIGLTSTAGATAASFITGRSAITIPDEVTNIISLNQNYAPSLVGEGAATGIDVRMGLTFGSATPAATSGRVRVRLMYTIDGKMSEVATQ